MTNKEIASKLKLSERIVQSHIYRIMKQLGTESRQEAVGLIRAIPIPDSLKKTC